LAKAPEAFRGISEVADLLGVRQHTLRAWETRYAFVRPVKRSDGRRFYRQSDIATMRELKRLIDEGQHSVVEIVRLIRSGASAAAGSHRTRAKVGSLTIVRTSNLRVVFAELEAAKSRLVAALNPSARQDGTRPD